jgi:hypothetical protein
MDAIVRALSMAFAMGWEILWPLILGFTLSGIVQAVVSHGEMSRLLPDFDGAPGTALYENRRPGNAAYYERARQAVMFAMMSAFDKNSAIPFESGGKMSKIGNRFVVVERTGIRFGSKQFYQPSLMIHRCMAKSTECYMAARPSSPAIRLCPYGCAGWRRSVIVRNDVVNRATMFCDTMMLDRGRRC